MTSIDDKGIGFDLENARTGLGLANMRERVELSGGRFSLESAQGKETVIREIWPLSSEQLSSENKEESIHLWALFQKYVVSRYAGLTSKNSKFGREF